MPGPWGSEWDTAEPGWGSEPRLWLGPPQSPSCPSATPQG